MPEKPVVVIRDVPIEGQMSEHFEALLRRTEVASPDRATSQQIKEAEREAIVLISRIQTVTGKDLAAMPRLRMVSAWGVGYNHIEVDAATERGIPVCINPVFLHSVAEAGLTLMLALAKRLPQLMRDACTGRRPLQSERGIELQGKTVGIIGYGRIGGDVGKLAHCLGMYVAAHDPYLSANEFPDWCRKAPLEEVLPSADFVVVSAPLTPETHHLIGKRELSLMKPSGYLINVARGALVDEEALLWALQEGQIGGAGLDVWVEEPVDPDHPLLKLENVIGTPHSLGATKDSMRKVCEAIQAKVFQVLERKRPEHVVNPEVFDQGGQNDR